MAISTCNLNNLPNIQKLKLISQSIAVLDAIIQPEWQFRYYSFDSKWSENEDLASMSSESGDEYYILFNINGAILKGFTHESKILADISLNNELLPSFSSQVPPCFTQFINEPAFELEYSSFCIWRTYSDACWNLVNYDLPARKDNDLSEDLLFILDGNPKTYKEWGESYYEREINLNCIQCIYQYQSLTKEIVFQLNPSIVIEYLLEDINKIGYPHSFV